MTFEIINGKAEFIEKYCRKAPYNVRIGLNGRKYVPLKSVTDEVIHIADGNSKTGKKVLNFNLSIELTCDKRFPCYTDCLCYAENGCYNFADNQALYSENTAFVMNHSIDEIATAFTAAIEKSKAVKMRYFTCGDIPNRKFLQAMVKTALDNPSVKFWTYTKKYSIVNSWIHDNGGKAESLPNNLKIIYSVWRYEDGDIIPIDNPYNMPTSEYIPVGFEELAEQVTHICPCSDPSVLTTCDDCKHPCYELLPGQSMALLAHSIAKTKERDKMIQAAHEQLKAAKKQQKQTNKQN